MNAVQQAIAKRRSFRVCGNLPQRTAWLCAATAVGLSVPKYLERAGDLYARHLALVQLRRSDKAGREMERSFYEARRKR